MNKQEWAKLAESKHNSIWLTDLEEKVLHLHYHRGWCIEDIAAELYVSRSTVNRTLQRIRKKLMQI